MKYLIYGIGIAFSLVIDVLSFRLITKENPKITWWNIILLFILTCITLIANQNATNILKVLIRFITSFIVIKTFYHISPYKVFYYAIIFWTTVMLIELIFTIFIALAGITNPVEFNNFVILKATVTFLIPIVQIALFYIPFIRTCINKFYNKYKEISISTDLYILAFIGIALLVVLNTINMDKMGSHYIVIVIVVIICILTVSIVMLYSRQKSLKVLNKKIMEKNDTFIEMADDYSTLRHNLINQFLSIKTVSNKRGQALIDDIINEYETKYKIVNNVIKIPKGLQGIIYQKIHQIEDINIKVNVVNSLKKDPFSDMKPRLYNELIETVGILLDNAIEACIQSYDKVIHIEFEENKNTHEINLIIINTFNGEIDLDAIGNRNYTTKKNGHGIGLHYILKKNKFILTNRIINNLYRAEIKIKDA